MSKILDWIKKHIWRTILIGFGLFFFPLILVHIAYRITAISPWFASTWQAGDLITYIAGFEAFIGTVILGAVALIQNDKALSLNERLAKIEEESGIFTRYPNISIAKSPQKYASFRDFFNSERSIFSCIDNLEVFRDSEENWEKNCFLFPFEIQNLSNFNVKISVTSIILKSKYGDEFSFRYDNCPINIRPEKAVIAPHNLSEIGIIVLDSTEVREHILEGKLDLSVWNYLNEEFHVTTTFNVLMRNDNSVAFFIMDHADASLIKK